MDALHSTAGRGRFNRVRRWLPWIAIVAVITVYLNVHFSNFSGRGQVVDYRTHQPLAGIELTGDCRRPNLIHGTHSIKHVRTRTDEQGRYRFSFADTWHCSSFQVIATKPGYVDMSGDRNYLLDAVPEQMWMLKASEVVPLKLEQLLGSIGGESHEASGKRAYLGEFIGALENLAEARRIATSDTHRAWIVERFCPLLSQKFALIPMAQRDLSAVQASYVQEHVAGWIATCPDAAALSGV